MKKIIYVLAAIVLLIPFGVIADSLTDGDGGTLTEADWVINIPIGGQPATSAYLTMIWTDTGGDGMAATDIPIPATLDEFWAHRLETDPGATAPTDNYDIAITRKTTGTPVFQGGCNDRDTSASEVCFPSSGYVKPQGEDFQVTITNNSQAGATGTIRLHLQF